MPNWLTGRAVLYIHSELLAEHGGLEGPSREGALEAALARPQQLLAYAPDKCSLERLAASYAFAFAKGHCFPDGNKRVALAAIDVFLRMNDRQLDASEEEVTLTIVAIAAGQLTEDELTAWIEQNSGPLKE